LSPDQCIADLRAHSEVQFEPNAADIATRAVSFDGAMHGDPADRIFATTAHVHRARIVAADQRPRGLREVVTV
jgi:PIN domain nuclease of toxin-antitoxin system